MPQPNLRDFRALAELRYQIRLFLSFSEGAARASGIEPQQHQLLLTCKGLPLGSSPNIGTLAARLCLEHNTVVQLIDKLQARGYVTRARSPENRREVLIALTESGEAALAHLSALHREQLRTAGPALHAAIGAILGSLEKPARVRGD